MKKLKALTVTLIALLCTAIFVGLSFYPQPVTASIGTGTFGKTAIGASSGTMTSTWSCNYTSSVAGNITSITAYLQPWGTPINFGVYALNGTRLAYTENTTQAEDGPKWYTRSFSSPLPITANTGYFLTVCTNATGADFFYDAGSAEWWVDGETTLPATINGDVGKNARNFSIYATYSYVVTEVVSGTFGKTDVGATGSTCVATWSCKYTAPNSGNITSLTAYLQPWGTPINFGVYDASGNQLGVTSNTTQAENGPKWYTRSFSSPIAITSGTDYFLTVSVNATGADYFNNATGVQTWWADSETSLPETINGDVTKSTRDFSIYATYNYETEVDAAAPTYTSLSSTSLIAGGTTKLNATVTDDVALSGYILQTNTTGIPANSTWTAFTSTPQTISKEVSLNGTIGNKVQWKYYFNDTTNNWNSTTLQTITLMSATATAVWIADDDYDNSFPASYKYVLSNNLTGLIDSLVENKITYALCFVGFWNTSTASAPFLQLKHNSSFYQSMCNDMVNAGIVPIAWGEDGALWGYGDVDVTPTNRDAYFTNIETVMDMGFMGYSENIESYTGTLQQWLDYHNNQSAYLHNIGKLCMPSVQFDINQNINNNLYVDFIISTFYGSDASLFEDAQGDYYFQENFGIYDGHNTPPVSPVMLGIKVYENENDLGWQLAEAKRCLDAYNPQNFVGFAFWLFEYVELEHPNEWSEWRTFYETGEMATTFDALEEILGVPISEIYSIQDVPLDSVAEIKGID